MKGITIRQPWAWAVVLGSKNVENRQAGFPKRYRGPVAIHSALGWSDRGQRDTRIRALASTRFDGSYPHLRWDGARPGEDGPFVRGHIIGVAELVDVHPASGCCEPWGEDSYSMNGGRVVTNVAHLLLENARQLDDPIPYRGALGLWNVPDEIATALT